MNTLAELSTQRSARLKKLRAMTGLSRKAFSQRYGISPATLQNWETSKLGGLSETGAHKILPCFYQHGIQVNYQWLMLGIGDGPAMRHARSTLRSQAMLRSRPKSHNEEIETFKKLNRNSVIYQIEDNTWAPRYQIGDAFFGVLKRTRGDIRSLKGSLCILQQAEAKLFLGYISSVCTQTKSAVLVMNKKVGELPTMGEYNYDKIWLVVAIHYKQHG